MKIIDSVKEFDEIIAEGKVLVDFFAVWCGPCKMIVPVLEEIADERDDVIIVKVDVDETPDLARRYGIMSIPTLLLFKDGQLVSKTMGYQDKDSLIDFIG